MQAQLNKEKKTIFQRKPAGIWLFWTGIFHQISKNSSFHAQICRRIYNFRFKSNNIPQMRRSSLAKILQEFDGISNSKCAKEWQMSSAELLKYEQIENVQVLMITLHVFFFFMQTVQFCMWLFFHFRRSVVRLRLAHHNFM